MRTFLPILLFIAFCAPASAQQAAPDTPDSAATGAAVSATRIEVDEQDNVIRFIVEGEERAVLGADGLHVRGDVTYGGRIKDVGEQAWPDDPAGAAQAGGPDEK